jgi:hypothetical protein
MPVTPAEIRQILFEDLTLSPISHTESKNDPKRSVLPGTSTPSDAIFFTTPLIQPTTYRSREDRVRVLARPSDDQIANHVFIFPPSNPGDSYTLEDDIRLVRLKEIDRLSWQEIATHFPGRKWGALQKRYHWKLQRAVEDFRPTEHTLRPIIQSTASRKKYTPEEDSIIIQAREIDNLDWPEIAQMLPDRSDRSAHGRYWYFLRKPDGVIATRAPEIDISDVDIMTS